MSQKEVLIILAHALDCTACRGRMLADPASVFRGRALTDAEKEQLGKLTGSDFMTAELLARSTGLRGDDLRAYSDHAVVRLRHF